jgi:hypothetical protein
MPFTTTSRTNRADLEYALKIIQVFRHHDDPKRASADFDIVNYEISIGLQGFDHPYPHMKPGNALRPDKFYWKSVSTIAVS